MSDDVPPCDRIQATVCPERSVTNAIRWASFKCAIETTLTRGLPSAVHRSRPTSSGSPASQASKPGAAATVLSRLASWKRSPAGKKFSRSRNPTRSTGGAGIARTSVPKSIFCPLFHRASTIEERSTCSRLRPGSASMPASARIPDTSDSIRSRRASGSSSTAAAGASRLSSIASGRPARLPGVYTAMSTAALSRAIRSGDCPLAARPSFHFLAVRSASASSVSPSRLAASASTQGRKSAGARSGNASRMLARSPLGSITSVGMPSIAASSTRSIKRPVLPLPVMPTHTACVVNRRASTSSGSEPPLPVLGSHFLPR
ncbi:hypothetical protein EBR56_00115 [bacterium]|nr:hypothetical protein [bacterium]